jgi:hypothetical protein
MVPPGDSEAMQILSKKVHWSRRGGRAEYVGILRGGDEGIRLSGRDARSAVDVAVFVPWRLVANIYRCSHGPSPDDVSVVVELWDAAPLVIRELGAGSHDPIVLTRKLTKLWHARLPVQGGWR